MHIPPRFFRETGRDYVLRVLRENIIQVELEPGSRVSENELAAKLGLSRTPVREALIELSKEKIVEIFPQQGSGITKIDFDFVNEARFVRQTLECAMLERLCGQGLTPEQEAQIADNLERQRVYEVTQDLQLFELDNQFHHMLFTFAHLENTYDLMRRMTIHLDRVRTVHLMATSGSPVVSEHRQIFEALKARDAAAAQAVMSGHITHYEQDDAIIREKFSQYIK